MVSIRYFSPAPALRDYISSYYWFEADAPHIRDLIRAELGQVRFVTSDPGSYMFADGRLRRTPRAMLTGPTAAPVLFEAHGGLRVFGAGLLPAGWSALIGAAADSLADDVIDLDALTGGAAHATLDRIANAGCDAARVAAADGFFTALRAQAHAVPLWFTRAADDWLTRSHDPQVDALIAATGVSARQAERLMRRIYGASPKLLARKYRTLQAAVRLTIGGTWADAAGEAFYDQSHFIREFKTFIGMTPTAFLTDAAPLNRLTVQGRRGLPGLPRLALIS